MVIDGQEDTCKALVKYLQVAIMRSVVNAAPALELAEAPTTPLADVLLLLEHCQCIFVEDFPKLSMEVERRQ